MSTRFTITDLRNIIEVCNQRLEQHGCLVRVEEFNRNGGYGTEHYPIDSEGNRNHSGSSHIASGSARSVARKTEAWAYQQINKQQKTANTMKLTDTKDNPYPLRSIGGFTVIQINLTRSFLVDSEKILQFDHCEGVLSDSTIKNWIAKNIK